jgi:N6-L-threonylcarbamoyladenine synthase
MRILGIETSCDETSVALLTVKRGISGIEREMTASQVLKHEAYGGVVPEVAARLHIEALPAIIREMKLTPKAIDAVAVTRGPGLVTSLRVGTDFARGLAYGWKKPIIGVNHIEGHIAANWIGQRVDAKSPYRFPAIVLVVSGGHTEIILMKAFGRYERLGSTKDDAVGEAFDKVAKMLDLGYPGGPAVSKRAEKGDPASFGLPRPMLSSPDLDFSFSGLKTAVLYTVQRKRKWSEQDVNDLCAAFQEAAVEVLVAKTVRAAKKHGAKTVFLAGGVAANRTLRGRLAEACPAPEIRCVLPDLKYCTDNAAMIAMAGAFRFMKTGKGDDWRTFEPDPNWELGV